MRRSQAATPRCCSTPRPSRQPPASPARTCWRSCSYRATSPRRRRAHRCSPWSAALFGAAARASARSTERGCTRIPNRPAIASASSGAAQRRVGLAELAGEGDHLAGELVRPPRAWPRRDQRRQPAGVHRGGRLVVRRPGEPERRRRPAHRLALGPHPAHHLVLDLHQVPGVEELRPAGERLISHRLRPRVQAARLPQRRLLRICPGVVPCRLPESHECKKDYAGQDTPSPANTHVLPASTLRLHSRLSGPDATS